MLKTIVTIVLALFSTGVFVKLGVLDGAFSQSEGPASHGDTTPSSPVVTPRAPAPTRIVATTSDENMREVNKFLGLRDDDEGESNLLYGDVLRLRWAIPEWKTIDETSYEMTDFIVEQAGRWPKANWVELSVELLEGSQRLQMGVVRSPDLRQVRSIAANFKGKLHTDYDAHFNSALSGLPHATTLHRRSVKPKVELLENYKSSWPIMPNASIDSLTDELVKLIGNLSSGAKKVTLDLTPLGGTPKGTIVALTDDVDRDAIRAEVARILSE